MPTPSPIPTPDLALQQAFGSVRKSPARTAGALAAVVVAGFLIFAALSFSSPAAGPGAGASAVTYSAAHSQADSQLPSGAWQLEAAIGLDLWNSTALPLNFTPPSPNCTVSPAPSTLPKQVDIAAFQGDLSTGLANFWILEYLDPNSSGEAVVVVSGDAVELMVTLGGPNCVVTPPGFQGVPANVVDSSAAAQALDADGGAAFLAAHRSGLSLSMILTAGVFSTSSVPAWDFDYTPCGPLVTPGNVSGPTNGLAFSGSVDGLTGAVENATESPVDCQAALGPPPGPTLGESLGLGLVSSHVGTGSNGTLASQGCASLDYCYELNLSAVANVTASDLELLVETSSGAISTVPVGFAILNAAGQVIVSSVGDIETTWSNGIGNSSTRLIAGDAIWVDMGRTDPTGQGYLLHIVGEGIYADSSIEVGLP